MNFPLVDRSNVSTRSKLHLQPMTASLFLSPKHFLIGHCFNQWDLFFSVYKPARQYLHFILTIYFEECQMKSFGMNLLLHAIFKFCTTKRLFWPLIFVSYFASQSKEIKFGDYSFDMCCVNWNVLVRCQILATSYSMDYNHWQVWT